MSTEYQDVCFPCQPLLSSSIRYPNECRMFQHPKSCLSMFLILSLRWFAKCLSVCSFMGLAMALPLVFLVRRAWLDTLTKQGMNSHNKNSTYWLEANDLSIQIMGRLSTWKHDLWKKNPTRLAKPGSPPHLQDAISRGWQRLIVLSLSEANIPKKTKFQKLDWAAFKVITVGRIGTNCPYPSNTQ